MIPNKQVNNIYGYVRVSTLETYKLIQDDYRKAAIEISSITESETGEILTASEIQAITWVAYRRIHKNLI